MADEVLKVCHNCAYLERDSMAHKYTCVCTQSEKFQEWLYAYEDSCECWVKKSKRYYRV